MIKRYMKHFASEHIDKVLDETNKYLASIEEPDSPVTDVQVSNIEHVNAFYHVWLLIVEDPDLQNAINQAWK